MTAVTEENMIADTLDAVAGVLKDQGWMLGPEGMRVNPGPKCILGAFAQVLGADIEEREGGRSGRVPGLYYSYTGLGASVSLRYFAATLGIHPPPTRIADTVLVNNLWNWNDDLDEGNSEAVLQRVEAAAHLARQANLSLLDEDTGRTEYAAAHLHHEAHG